MHVSPTRHIYYILFILNKLILITMESYIFFFLLLIFNFINQYILLHQIFD